MHIIEKYRVYKPIVCDMEEFTICVNLQYFTCITYVFRVRKQFGVDGSDSALSSCSSEGLSGAYKSTARGPLCELSPVLS